MPTRLSRLAVEGPLPTDLLLGLSLWTADDTWLVGDPEHRKTAGDLAFGKILPDLLDKLEGKVAKRGRHLRSLDTDDLHDLRKALKKLRYACEDVSSLFKPKAVDHYVGACKKVLQDLGRINDAAVTEVRVAELALVRETRPPRRSRPRCCAGTPRDVAPASASSGDDGASFAARTRSGRDERRLDLRPGVRGGSKQPCVARATMGLAPRSKIVTRISGVSRRVKVS